MAERLDVVSGLYFGRDDAEHDAVDGLLNAGFLATAAFEETLLGRKSLIIGRKRSGESAICTRLTMPEVKQVRKFLGKNGQLADQQLQNRVATAIRSLGGSLALEAFGSPSTSSVTRCGPSSPRPRPY